MADNDIRYRFVLKGSYTPETIPQARLAEYLAALADLYGREDIVHFVGLETSSLAILSRPEAQAEDDVAERVEAAHQDDAPAESRRAFATLSKLIVEDRAESAYIERQGATVLNFPTGEKREQETVYGPFWQRGHLTGTVILLGGKTEVVSVKLQVKEKTITCKAKRAVARDLRDYIWGSPVRVEGNGKWTRDSDGRWNLLEFQISSFDAIDDEPLTTTVARLRAVEGKWKDRPDPLAELESIRNDDDGEH